jgi:hypothetical protein
MLPSVCGTRLQLGDLSHIGLSETQLEQFTQRNIMSTVWASAHANSNTSMDE